MFIPVIWTSSKTGVIVAQTIDRQLPKFLSWIVHRTPFEIEMVIPQVLEGFYSNQNLKNLLNCCNQDSEG